QAFNGNNPRLTGSLQAFADVTEHLVKDNEWFTEHVVAIGNRIVIKINERITVDYTDYKRTYSSGYLALQHWTPPVVTRYRNVMVKPLPANPATAWEEARRDMPDLSTSAK